MAVKTKLFLLAFAVLIAQMHSHVEVPVKAPTPANALVHSPTKAPADAPRKHHHVHPPKKAPIHARAKPPSMAPHISPVSSIHGCVAICEDYCKPMSPKRPCMKVCTACCAKYNCVPIGSKKCSNWDRVMIHGAMAKCP